MTAQTPGQAEQADVLASLPRQWDAEADATAHWGNVSAPERAAYANGLRDCASELRKVLAAREPQPAPPSASQSQSQADCEQRTDYERLMEALFAPIRREVQRLREAVDGSGGPGEEDS